MVYNTTGYANYNQYTQYHSTESTDFYFGNTASSGGNVLMLDVSYKGAVQANKLERSRCEYCWTGYVYNPDKIEKVLTRLECEACGAPLDLL